MALENQHNQTPSSDELAGLFPDVADSLNQTAHAMDGILALRARHDQLIQQRKAGGPWGPSEVKEFEETSEYLGLIDDQERRARDKVSSRRTYGGNILKKLFTQKPK